MYHSWIMVFLRATKNFVLLTRHSLQWRKKLAVLKCWGRTCAIKPNGKIGKFFERLLKNKTYEKRAKSVSKIMIFFVSTKFMSVNLVREYEIVRINCKLKVKYLYIAYILIYFNFNVHEKHYNQWLMFLVSASVFQNSTISFYEVFKYNNA